MTGNEQTIYKYPSITGNEITDPSLHHLDKSIERVVIPVDARGRDSAPVEAGNLDKETDRLYKRSPEPWLASLFTLGPMAVDKTLKVAGALKKVIKGKGK